MKHTKGPWAYHEANYSPSWRSDRYLIETGNSDDPECGNVAHMALQGNAELIALAPTAPHDCEDPACPGAINKQKLEAAEEMARALSYIRDQDDKPKSTTILSNHVVLIINDALSAWEKAGKGE